MFNIIKKLKYLLIVVAFTAMIYGFIYCFLLSNFK
jgi:preprotein translocase subunit SecE